MWRSDSAGSSQVREDGRVEGRVAAQRRRVLVHARAGAAARLEHDLRERRARLEAVLDPDVDRRVGERGHVLRLPVLLPAGRVHRVEQLLERDVRHRRDEVDRRRDLLAQRPQRLAALLDAAEVGDHDPERRAGRAAARGTNSAGGAVTPTSAPPTSSGADCMKSRQWRTSSRPDSGANSIRPPSTTGPTGCRRYSSAVTTPKLPPPPRSAQKRSGFSSSLGAHEPAVGGHDLRREQVVGREAVLALEPAAAAAERQAGDPGRRDAPAGGRQAERLRRPVELGPEHAARGAHGARRRRRPRSPSSARGRSRRRRRRPRSRPRRGRRRAPRAAGRARARSRSPRATSARRAAAGDHLRAAVDHRVEDPAGRPRTPGGPARSRSPAKAGPRSVSAAVAVSSIWRPSWSVGRRWSPAGEPLSSGRSPIRCRVLRRPRGPRRRSPRRGSSGRACAGCDRRGAPRSSG